jgi:hypothetical protein
MPAATSRPGPPPRLVPCSLARRTSPAADRTAPHIAASLLASPAPRHVAHCTRSHRNNTTLDPAYRSVSTLNPAAMHAPLCLPRGEEFAFQRKRRIGLIEKRRPLAADAIGGACQTQHGAQSRRLAGSQARIASLRFDRQQTSRIGQLHKQQSKQNRVSRQHDKSVQRTSEAVSTLSASNVSARSLFQRRAPLVTAPHSRAAANATLRFDCHNTSRLVLCDATSAT